MSQVIRAIVAGSRIDSDMLTRPDVDLADGEFYAGNSRPAYSWTRANEPVFRDRNGLAGAAFDEQQFENPEQFDIERHPNNHLAFGFGTHFCMGNQLARLEISLMTRRVIERLPDLHLASDEVLPVRPANFVSGLETMPVVFTATKPVGP